MIKEKIKKLLVKDTLAMSRTVAQDPLQKFKFRVSIPGLPAGIGFQKVSGLSREVDVAEYDESGYGYTHKLPSNKEKVGDVTFERGTYASKDLEGIYKKTLTDPNFRCTVTVTLCDKFGNAKRTWVCGEAFFKSIEESDLDASSSDVAIQKAVMCFEYFID